MSIHRSTRRSRATRLAVAAALATAFFLAVDARPASATSILVDSESSYRAALTALSIDASGPHVVELTGDVVFSGDGVDGSGDAVYTGSEALTILGNGYTLDLNREGRGLYTNHTPHVTVRELTVTRGQGGQQPGGACCGGLYVSGEGGQLDIIDSVLRDNRTAGNGDAAAASAQMVRLFGSTVTGNLAYDDSGGVTGSVVVVVDSTISDNVARGYRGEGAGVIGYHVTVKNSTITNNVLTSGAGGFGGGGIWARGTLTLEHATVAGNIGPSGKADNVVLGDTYVVGSMTSFASVIEGGTPNCDARGGTTASTYSYDDDGSCGFVGVGDTSNGADPMLAALADNGGPTWTMLPDLATSPLVDGVASAECTLAVDQRGVWRPQGTGCDIGAVEVERDDPGGFVTGGGWFRSEPGAYTPEHAVEGKTHIELNARYREGDDILLGMFSLRLGDLRFRSSSLDWLVVPGDGTAVVTGHGTIDGQGDHRFMVWVDDDRPDTLRIRVWTESDGVETITYDSGSDLELRQGNLTVHEGTPRRPVR